MAVEAYITLVSLFTFLALVLSGRMPADATLLLVMVALMVFGVLTPQEALAGFSNPALFVIASFYVVSSAVRESGALQWMVQRWLGRTQDLSKALPRVILPVSAVSGFISNTPVVAMFIPQLQDWGRRHGVAASKLLLPLSYASILGGTCTLIGTSTNLLISGMLDDAGMADQLSLFAPAWVGVPLVLVGLLYFATLGRRWLPECDDVVEKLNDARRYAVMMRVDEQGPLVGKTIMEAGLRDLQHSFLAELHSGKHIMPAVPPETQLSAGDVLVFVGQPETITELREIRGLAAEDDQLHKLDVPTSSRAVVEAVLAPRSTMVGKTVKQVGFRSNYGGVILSISRGGEIIKGKIGQIILQAGDTLLIEAARGFIKRHRYKPEFLLLSRIDHVRLPDTSKAPITMGSLALFLVVVVMKWVPISAAAMVLVAVLLAGKCISVQNARNSLDLRVVGAIGASLALGLAMQKTGLAQLAAEGILSAGGGHPWLSLALLYMAAVLITETVTNNAAAVLLFPLAIAMAESLQISPLPLIMTIMYGASASFITPFGYQTNLMVQGPGGYQAADYVRVGLPLSVLVGVCVVALVPFVWPF